MVASEENTFTEFKSMTNTELTLDKLTSIAGGVTEGLMAAVALIVGSRNL